MPHDPQNLLGQQGENQAKGATGTLFDRAAMGLAKTRGADASRMGMEPANTRSDIKHPARGGLFFRSADSLLNRLKKGRRGPFNSMGGCILSKCVQPKTGCGFFGGARPAAMPAALKSMAEDVLLPARKFHDGQAAAGMGPFRNLVRPPRGGANPPTATAAGRRG
jgi:hypothetical protein